MAPVTLFVTRDDTNSESRHRRKGKRSISWHNSPILIIFMNSNSKGNFIFSGMEIASALTTSNTRDMETNRFDISLRTHQTRRKAFWVFVIFGFSFLPYGVCSAMTPGKEMQDHKTHVLDANSNGKEIAVAPGDLIEIQLQAKGATGYQWQLDKNDPAHATLVSEGIKAVSSSKLGSPVTNCWKFRIMKEGRSEIAFLYFRSWEGRSMAVEEYVVKLDIR